MLIIAGVLIVLIGTVVSFLMGGGEWNFGRLVLLLYPAELIAIFGITLGAVVIATPGHVLKGTFSKIIAAVSGNVIKREHYFELIGALYELFQTGRKNGLLSLEEHLSAPAQSSIFKKYPTLLNVPERLSFVVDSLKPLVDGRIKPDQLDGVI